MLPEITWKNLKNIEFPIYKLNSDEIHYYQGILYCQNKVIDDRNLPGNTIGLRRLQSKDDLYSLKQTALDVTDMLNANYRHFIDNKGRAFSYKKTKWCTVKSFKITKIIHKEICSIVKIRGSSATFVVRRPPQEGVSWAGIIVIDKYPWKLLEYTYYEKPSYIRMI